MAATTRVERAAVAAATIHRACKPTGNEGAPAEDDYDDQEVEGEFFHGGIDSAADLRGLTLIRSTRPTSGG